jgi:hypothetical protein
MNVTQGARRGSTVAISLNAKVRHLCLAATVAMTAATALHADTFSSAYYDSKTNELVVTMLYRGTNPGHQFPIK